jgi:hypothetical protein
MAPLAGHSAFDTVFDLAALSCTLSEKGVTTFSLSYTTADSSWHSARAETWRNLNSYNICTVASVGTFPSSKNHQWICTRLWFSSLASSRWTRGCCGRPRPRCRACSRR